MTTYKFNEVLFISENTLKTESDLNDNVDSCYIGPAIKAAQDIGLQTIIGTELYDKLANMIADGSIKNPENLVYKNLMDVFIKPYMINKTIAEIQVPITFKTRNSGLVQTNNENEVNTALSDAKYISKFYNDRADFYGLRIKEYLIDNNIPEYQICENKNPVKGFNTGIYLGRVNKFV